MYRVQSQFAGMWTAVYRYTRTVQAAGSALLAGFFVREILEEYVGAVRLCRNPVLHGYPATVGTVRESKKTEFSEIF